VPNLRRILEFGASPAALGVARPVVASARALGYASWTHGQKYAGDTAMAYTLPPLPYPFNALEPYIDAKTMEIHHDKHHQAYITNLNKAIEGTDLGNQSIESLVSKIDSVPENIRTAVRNNGGGHANHSLFWTVLAHGGGGQPSGPLAEAIKRDLGGYDKFKEAFTEAGLKRFGSGWAWLSVDKSKKLIVESAPNQDSPLMHGNTPILGCDVWEHAYYLLYQNRRPDYVTAFFNVINWPNVSERYAAAMK
jgi:Fe-Mn family superoxide dismutase